MSIKEVFKDSVKIVIKHYWLFLLVTLINILSQFGIMYIVDYFCKFPPCGSVLSILPIFIGYAGLFILLLRIRNEKLTKQRSLAFLKSFWELFIFIIALVISIATVGIVAIVVSMGYLPIAFVMSVVCFVLGVYLLCRYLFAGIIIFDANCSIEEAFATSAKITKGNIFKILLFVLFIITPGSLQILSLILLFGLFEGNLLLNTIAIFTYAIFIFFLLPFWNALYLKCYEALR